MHRVRPPVVVLAIALLGAACASVTTTTAPPPPISAVAPAVSPPGPLANATTGFLAFGDAGTGDAAQTTVATAMRQWIAAGHRVDALVEAGDNVYPDGDPSRYQASLDDPYAPVRGSRPFWVALGNHDVQSGHGAEELAHLSMPTPPSTESLPGVQLLFLDSNQPAASQSAWLDATLAAPGPALRVVVFHHPAYSCATHGSTPSIDAGWVPILEAHRVALVITGHDHYYERFESANGVTYVVTGGGGAATYPRDPGCTGTPPSRATASARHFVGIEVRDSTLVLTAVDGSQHQIDRTTITR